MIHNNRERDFWSWKCSKDGLYQFKKVWNLVRSRFEIKYWASLVWNKIHVPKMAVCLFKAINDYLLTKERLIQKQIVVDQNCVFCNNYIENIDHLFFQCNFTEQVWLWSCKFFFKSPRSILSFSLRDDLQKIVFLSSSKNLNSDLFQLSLSACVWHIWKERNDRIFQNRFKDRMQICHNIFQTMNIRMVKSKHFKNITDFNGSIALKWGYTFQS